MRTVERVREPVTDYVHGRVVRWRTGTREGQVTVLVVLLAGVAASFAVSVHEYGLMPLTAYFVWLLLGMLLLRFHPLLVLVLVTTGLGVLAVALDGPLTMPRTSAVVALVVSAMLILYQASRQRSGLPGPLGEAMLVDLRDRLQRQSRVPDLPAGWSTESAMLSAGGIDFAGDFLVADLSEDGQHLEMILVDVCGKGVEAGTQSLQFAGALGGLIGALPPQGLLGAANDFLLRQHQDESFATAVHVLMNLRTGAYEILSAGHPPALRWDAAARAWDVDNARGTALGIARRPELHESAGVLGPGDALMFYTDGVVERRGASLDEGVAWLRRVGASAVSGGFAGAARRIIGQVPRGDDDRALLLIWRQA